MTSIILSPDAPSIKSLSIPQLAARNAAREILRSGRWVAGWDRAFLRTVATFGRVSQEGRERLADLAGRRG